VVEWQDCWADPVPQSLPRGADAPGRCPGIPLEEFFRHGCYDFCRYLGAIPTDYSVPAGNRADNEAEICFAGAWGVGQFLGARLVIRKGASFVRPVFITMVLAVLIEMILQG